MLRVSALRAALVVIAAASSSAHAEVDVVIAPVERALERVSFGPQVGIAATASTRGVGAMATLGFSGMVFDRFVRTDPQCEAARREERRRLGGEKVKPWGDVVESLQQPCRAIEQWWYPKYEGGLELGLGIGDARGAQLRAFFARLSWWRLTVGVSVSAVPTTLDVDGTRTTLFGLRLGPEVGVHFRQTYGEWRPVLSAFVRAEAAVVGREHLPDQAVLGVRYLFDL